MKIIRITTDLEMTVHDFPEGTHEAQNHVLRELIGNDCRIYEHVMPERLYTSLKMKNRPTKVPGQCVSMLIDEEGLLKPNHANMIGSYLYKFDEHKIPIAGNILFVGEEWTRDIRLIDCRFSLVYCNRKMERQYQARCRRNS